MEIFIRKATIKDAKSIAKIIRESLEKGFSKYTGTNKPFGKEKIKEFEKHLKNKKEFINFVAIDKKDNRIIGNCSFDGGTGRFRHKGELGWIVHPAYIKKGIATKLLISILKEAKKEGYKKAEAEIAMENNPSIKLAMKVGMKIEGKLRKGILLDDGRYIDTYLVGKVLEE